MGTKSSKRTRHGHPDVAIAFQPVVHADEFRVDGYEALARGPDGKLPRVIFDNIPSKRLYEFDAMCRRQALAAAQALGLTHRLCINVTPGAICHPHYGLTETVRYAQEIGFPCDKIIFEVTEHEAIPDYDAVRRCLDACRQEGIRIVLDDFGSGFNGLTTLLNLMPDGVKLDMRLIEKIEIDVNRQKFVASVCEGCNRINLEIVAEGIETKEAAVFMQTCGVHFMQGYLFAEPMIGQLPLLSRDAGKVEPSWG